MFYVFKHHHLKAMAAMFLRKHSGFKTKLQRLAQTRSEDAASALDRLPITHNAHLIYMKLKSAAQEQRKEKN